MTRFVISGMGVVSPIGIGRQKWFESLTAGTSGVARISSFDPSGLTSRIAGEVRDFNPGDWFDPKQLRHVSRAVPMVLAATAEALEDAKLDPKELDLEAKRRVAVMLGTGGGAIEFSERMYELWYAGKERKASVYSVPSGTIGTISSEISMIHDLHGFSHVISTGCTSSTDALGYALNSLRLGLADQIVVGGVDTTITEGVMTGFGMMKIVSTRFNDEPERASRPFDAERDGFVLGEGSWMFVLEKEESARARGAHIYAELAGYGSTCDAYHRVRLDESGEEPARAMELAMEDAGVSPEQVGYINYHGTSTELNDRAETRAVKRAFGDHAGSLAGSATKSMIGHPQGACGSAGVAATLLALTEGILPPTINLENPDPECDLDYVPLASRPARVDVALCNTIAFGSKNAALVLRKI
ncbi:MAG: beta-ketoacyl-[acyl-carrier-protein] synthase family protein [Acidobacteria bacterium]|nr:beta-ketoacyl-[acyl-carrier-protein] synthase family protein [Acidobacteriota bacterium]